MFNKSLPVLKYFTNQAHRNKRLYERWGNYKTYLENPLELLWRIRANQQSHKMMEDAELQRIRTESSVLFSGTQYDKYLHFQRYFAINLRRVYRLGLDRSKPLRILDIGSGCGFFSKLCTQYGHQPHGLDIPGIPIFDHLMPEFRIPRTEFFITPGVPLPDFETKFDLVVAFAICIHELGDNRRWSRDDWQFFLKDMKEHVVVPGGRLYLFFNDYPHGDFEDVRGKILPCPYKVIQSHKVLDISF